eukprot:1376435-Amorphochlora_amoeboformis.AAC.2
MPSFVFANWWVYYTSCGIVCVACAYEMFAAMRYSVCVYEVFVFVLMRTKEDAVDLSPGIERRFEHVVFQHIGHARGRRCKRPGRALERNLSMHEYTALGRLCKQYASTQRIC